jgi:vancomycin permeability regulator SanA
MIPELMYKLLYNATWIDIHNLSAIPAYIVEYIDILIYSFLSYLEFILLATIILTIKAGRHKPDYNKNYIIILGCKVNKDKTLPPLLKGRVDKAIEFAKKQKEETNKDITFITSGGKGTDETISEAMAMKNYLIEQGIDKDNIIVEDKSTNTYQNFKYSLELIDKNDPNILFSTTNYHVFRAGNIASKINTKIEGIGAKTKTYFYINAFIREYVATMISEKKKHISILAFIAVSSLLLIILFYLSNIIV